LVSGYKFAHGPAYAIDGNIAIALMPISFILIAIFHTPVCVLLKDKTAKGLAVGDFRKSYLTMTPLAFAYKRCVIANGSPTGYESG